MVDLIQVFGNVAETIINAIPAVLIAIIVIVVGYFVGSIVGKAVNRIITKIGMEKAFENSMTGKTFKSTGMELSSFIGGIIKAFIIILSVILAIQILNIEGVFGAYLSSIANYLPRLLGGILILVFGLVLVDFLASFIGKMIKPMFPEAKSEIADMLKNLLLIGLIAFILLLVFETLLLEGSMIYPLILGFVIISAGISLTDGLIKSINDDHAEFRTVSGYAKFLLYSIFLLIGAGAIFANFTDVAAIVGNISWAFAIAFAVMLIPIIYSIAKKMTKETL